MDKPLILVGGGGHCRSVIGVAESAAREILGILDLPEFAGTESAGYRVIGCDDDMKGYAGSCDFVITLGMMGNPRPRCRLAQLVAEAGGELATLIAPTAYVSPSAQIGAGTVVHHQSSVNVGAQIGTLCIVNTGAIIEHDAVVGDNTHISTGARVNGGCRIGSGCFIGSGATIVNGVTVCDGVTIGAGSVVISDINEPGVYVGVPSRKIR